MATFEQNVTRFGEMPLPPNDAAQHTVISVLPYAIPLIVVILFSIRSAPYGAPRVGKTRWWSLIPGQVPMRFEMDKWMEHGYQKYHKALMQPFVTKVFGRDYLLMPPKYLNDVRKADENNLSFAHCFSEAFNVNVSAGDVYASSLMPDVVKQWLNPQLPSLVPSMNAECEHIFEEGVAAGSEWKTVNTFQTFTAMAHQITSRILLGESLARNKDFVETSQSFNRSLFISAILVNGVWLGPLRNVVAWFTAIKHRRDLRRCVQHLIPEIEKARNQPERNDAVRGMLELAQDDARESQPERMAHQLMHLMFAGSSAPGGLAVQMIYQVLTSPAYLAPLRREISETLAVTGGFDTTFLSRTPLLESFVRETMRLYPTGVVSVTRAVMEEPFRFHDGLTVPKGARFAFPIHAIHRDPDNYEDPLSFCGFRTAGAAYADRKETNASSVDATFLNFGYGRHACPGRFYAVRLAKLILAKLLHEYDVEWEGKMAARPPNMCIEVQNGPNMDASVRLRKRVKVME